MTAETQDTEVNAQALWDSVATEREAGESSPSEALEAAENPTSGDVSGVQHDANSEDATDAQASAAEEAKDKAAPAEPQAAIEDLYEGLSPKLKARFQALEALERQVQQIPALTQRVNTAEGRVAAMQRERDVAKQAATVVKDAPSTAQIAAAAVSTEKWDSLKADFPEWADATEQFLNSKLAKLTPQTPVEGADPQKIAELVEQRVNAVRAEMAKVVEEAKVEGKHANWREDINSDGFVKWFKVQQPEVQALANSPKGRDAIRMLDLYQEALAKPVDKTHQERANKLAAAVSTKPGSASVSVAKSVDDMTPEELWDYEAKQATKRGKERGLIY